jgi:hypothetical protein
MTTVRLSKECMAGRHLGIICQVCLRYWRMLPPHVHGHLDPDTMIADCVAVVTQKGMRHYSRRRAMESTFVHMVAESYCKNVLMHYSLQKRMAAGIVQLDHVLVDRGDIATGPLHDFSWRHRSSSAVSTPAKQSVERVMEYASDGLRMALERFLLTRRFTCIEGFLDELRTLVRQHGVSRDDMASALRLV